MKEIKGSYEKQLVSLRTELKSLNTARKEHAKAMRKNVRDCTHVHVHVHTCIYMYVSPAGSV